MTRQADEGWGPCIDERAAIANRVGAHLLLSLHADGASAGARGFHVITPALTPGWTDDIFTDSQRAGISLRDALMAAGVPIANYIGQHGLDSRSDLGTLNRSDVPAVMLEAGNLRNVDDAALLTSNTGRATVAAGISQAVLNFFAK